jgi:methionine biosynthesis protein MetW
VNVIEQDLDSGLANFADNSFDLVVMTDTLQSVKEPLQLLDEMLRIGHQCIVTFPNFGHWRCRLYLALHGRMPVSEHLPHSWYDTPNIHLCTFLDFERLCKAEELDIIERFVVDHQLGNRPLINRFPNFFGTFAFYRLGRS